MGVVLKVIGTLLGIVVVAVVVVGGLALLGAPTASCADGAISTSSAAEASYNTKWNGFNAALGQGGVASVTLTEQEITSRAASYLAGAGVPAKELQVHLCPGQGTGQATATVSALGLNVGVVAAGHLDLASKPSRVVADSLQVGQVPPAVGTLVAGIALNAANVEVSSDIREVTTTSTSATLKGQR